MLNFPTVRTAIRMKGGCSLTIAGITADAVGGRGGCKHGECCDPLLLGCERLVFIREVPPAPRMTNIPLPFTDENDHLGASTYHQSTQLKDTSNQEAEVIVGLAAAKPEIVKNEEQLRVSVFFTPPKIVLYNNGLDNSQTSVDLRPAGPNVSKWHVHHHFW